MNELTADDYYREEYETRIIDAMCDCCSAESRGTPQQLIARGWLLGKREQICPMHD